LLIYLNDLKPINLGFWAIYKWCPNIYINLFLFDSLSVPYPWLASAHDMSVKVSPISLGFWARSDVLISILTYSRMTPLVFLSPTKALSQKLFAKVVLGGKFFLVVS
jgi:hypothetical protein